MPVDVKRKLRQEATWQRVKPVDEDLADLEVLVWGGWVHGTVEVRHGDREVFYGSWPGGHTGACLTRARARRFVLVGTEQRITNPETCPVEGQA